MVKVCSSELLSKKKMWYVVFIFSLGIWGTEGCFVLSLLKTMHENYENLSIIVQTPKQQAEKSAVIEAEWVELLRYFYFLFLNKHEYFDKCQIQKQNILPW